MVVEESEVAMLVLELLPLTELQLGSPPHSQQDLSRDDLVKRDRKIQVCRTTIRTRKPLKHSK